MIPRSINKHYGGSDSEWSRLFDERCQRLAERLKARQQNCPACGQLWPASELESLHQCPGARIRIPTLFLGGRRLGRTIHQVGVRTRPEDWVVREAADAYVNGRRVAPSELPQLLSAAEKGTFDIELRHGLRTEPVKVDIAIASTDDLDLVDEAAWRLVQTQMERRDVDSFIAESSAAGSAGHYIDGLASYFFGVMDRNGSPAAQGHVELYERASVALGQYRRLPAVVAHGLMAFYFNTFEASDLMQEPPALEAAGAAAARIRVALDGRRPDLSDFGTLLPAESPESLMADSITGTILRTTLSPTGLRDDLVKPTRYDRFKLDIIDAELALSLGDAERARRVASRYRNNPVAAVWAESIVGADGGTPRQ